MHVAGAVTTSFGVLLAARVAGALANAGFLAVGLATATAMPGPGAKGRAASVLLGGIRRPCPTRGGSCGRCAVPGCS
ncbi:hypothetical protein ACQP2K_26245 [Microbispora siamensis]